MKTQTLLPAKIQVGSRLIYNDARPGHTDILATVLTVETTRMIVQFADRADTTAINFADCAWMDYLKLAPAVSPFHQFIPAPETVARAFCELLEKYLGRAKLAQAAALNAADVEKSGCHSHDFCDANVFMDDAIKMVAGYAACDTGGEGIGCMSAAMDSLWEKAWAIAKAADFNMPRLPYTVTVKFEGQRARRLYVADVSGAQGALTAMLPAVFDAVPIVKTRGGEVVAVMKV